ncbi:MAG: helix-turn-helix domain-containing protein [Saprospiraceae bacterium]
MRRKLKIPKILKIDKINSFQVYCVFNNGEHRIIDFNNFFKEWKLKQKKKDFRYPLLDKKVFNKIALTDNTLGWESIKKKIKLSNGMEYDVSFELDPIVLFENSQPNEEKVKENSIGKIIKSARTKAGLTQEELARKSGTTRYYISRIENDRSDIELSTLRKIIEIGLNKSLNIQVR